MTEEKKEETKNIGEDFNDLLSRNVVKVPQVGELIRGKVITASKAEVKLDIDGFMTGVVRGPELYEEDDEYATLKPGEEVDATVIDNENENGELELSFRIAGQARAWAGIQDAYENKKIIRVRIVRSRAFCRCRSWRRRIIRAFPAETRARSWTNCALSRARNLK